MAYFIVIMIADDLENVVRSSRELRGIVGLLPVIPLCGAAAFIMGHYRTGDELQKRVVAESIMFAFGVTAIASLSYGFLEFALDLPPISAFCIWPFMGAAWFVGSIVTRRRYR